MEIFSTVILTIGIIAFAVSGAMIAIRRKTDLFGVIMLAILTALGGGLSRDVIFGFTPPSMFFMRDYLLLSALVAVFVFLCARAYSKPYLENETRIEHINDIFDALGLGIFAVVGTQVAIQYGYTDNAVIVIGSGLITCIGGGIIRDILTMCVPFVLVKRIYAIAAICGSSVYYIMFLLQINDSIAILAGTLTTFILRILAMIFKWNFPKAIK